MMCALMERPGGRHFELSPEHSRASEGASTGTGALPIIRSEFRIISSMGDAGEGLVDAESRLAERMDEREEEKKQAQNKAKAGDPERTRQFESYRLARIEMERQLELASHKARKQQLSQAIAELDRRIAELSK